MMDLSVIIAVDGDAHIIEKNIFYRQELISDPRVVVEVLGSAGIFMNSMMKDASGYVGAVCPKVAAMKNERTLKIFCEAAARDKDSWPCTIFATESTLPIVLDACDCNRLVVVAPHNRNADFTFGMWRLAETNSFTPRSENESGFDIMIYEPTGDLMISESELDAELERLCREMDSDVFDPPSKEDEEAIAKVLDFVKGGLVVDNSHLDGFDNDYEDVIGMEEIMKDVTEYVKNSLRNFVQMSLFQRALDVQNGALKRLSSNEEKVNQLEQTIDKFRSSMADTSSLCGDGIRSELETVNLKYNSVNERLDGLNTQIGNVVYENAMRKRKTSILPLAISIVALVVSLLGLLF